MYLFPQRLKGVAKRSLKGASHKRRRAPLQDNDKIGKAFALSRRTYHGGSLLEMWLGPRNVLSESGFWLGNAHLKTVGVTRQGAPSYTSNQKLLKRDVLL